MPQPGEVGTPDTRHPRRAHELHALADAYFARSRMNQASRTHLAVVQFHRGIAFRNSAYIIDAGETP